MSRSQLTVIVIIAALLITIGILSWCGVSSLKDLTDVTAVPRGSIVPREETVEPVYVTQTSHDVGPVLSPTVVPTTLSATFVPIPASPLSVVTPTPLSTLPADIPILPPDASRAARNLHVNAHCSINEPWKGIAELTWVPALDRGFEQRVVMTVYRDGFEKGVFDASEMLSVDQSNLEWERLSPGIIHFWRVLTRYEDGWVPSDDSSFEAPVCAVDFATTPGP